MLVILILLALTCKIAIAHGNLTIAIGSNNSSLPAATLKSILATPPNTECASSIRIGGPTQFDNREALTNSSTTCVSTWKFLWYSFQAPATGFAQISTCNSADFDTVLAMYTTCANFPTLFNGCNNDYCGTTSLLNFAVTKNRLYFIAVGGRYFPDDLTRGFGTGTLKVSQATLVLMLPITTVSSAGGPVTFTASTTATDNFEIFIRVRCGDGTPPPVVYEGTFTTSQSPQQFPMPAQPAGTTCGVRAIDKNLPSFGSNTVTLTVIAVQKDLTITKPTNGQSWPINEPLTILVTSDPSETGIEATVTFGCPSGNILRTVKINEESSVTIDATAGAQTCPIVATSTGFNPSPPVSVTFTVPTWLNTNNLNDWQGGSTVAVRVETYNSAVVSILLNVSCPGSTASYPISTETDETISLPGNMSGVDCLITTSGMPADYFPIIPQPVVIQLGTAALVSFIQTVFSPAFSPVNMELNQIT